MVIVPGYAILALIHHWQSTESFWLLGVYGDISNGSASLLTFYKHIRNFIADLVLSPDHTASWSGCITTGDWNLVVHPDDHSPHSADSAQKRQSINVFKHIMDLCHLQDMASPSAYPQGFTFSGNTGRKTWSSHLDSIYYLMDSWFTDRPSTVPTLWSDHKLVWAKCGIISPRVQITVAAPCLPNIDSLTHSKKFWGLALAKYKDLTSQKVTLESWSLFKKDILSLGSRVWKISTAEQSSKWKVALRGDAIPLEDLPAAVEAAQKYVKV